MRGLHRKREAAWLKGRKTGQNRHQSIGRVRRDGWEDYGCLWRTENLLEDQCSFLWRQMPGTDRSLKGHSGCLLAKGLVKGTCRCEHTRWEVSAGNQVREHGNLVRGYIRENSL